MQRQVFSISTKGTPEAMLGLNQFLRSHRILSVERQLVEDGANSYWTFCVEYFDGQTVVEPKGMGKVDYKEVL